MKQKLVALLLISVVVASAFGAIGLSATKVSAAGETLTLSSTNYSPTAGQQYTLSGTLIDNVGNALANKPIDIYYHFPGAGWHYSNTVYTGTDGKYSATTSSSQSVYLQTGYKFGSAYVASSNVVIIYMRTASTTLTLSSSNYYPDINYPYTLSGLLTDSAGNPLANKPINIWYHFAGETAWHFSNTIYTGTDGNYRTTTSSSRSVYLKTVFNGDSGYTYSESAVVSISLRIPTTLTLLSSNYYPDIGQQYMLSGYLGDSGGKALANKPINIYYHFLGGNWQYSNTVYTGADGTYSTTTSSSRSVSLWTQFPGDSSYKFAGSEIVPITVQ